MISAASSMQLRTILVAVSGGAASQEAINAACRLARRFESHLEGMHVAVHPEVPNWPASRTATRALSDAIRREADAAAATARQMFDAAADRHGLPLIDAERRSSVSIWGASACWRQETGLDTRAVARRARLFDLVVLGRSSRAVRQASSLTVEHTLLEAGRPVLVVGAPALEKLGDAIALAWNDTAQASRALSAAMPLLKDASRTHILCFGDARMGELLQQLEWYGIRATGHRFPPLSRQRVETGELLLAATRDCQADLLVMGAYGHAPWWESLFGGATREVLNKESFPILLAH